MQRFTELRVWRDSHQLVLRIYRLTRAFPAEERFGITNQLRRACVSVPANIAEGSKRRSKKAYAQFLNIAEASLAETEYFIILASDLGHISSTEESDIRRDIEKLSKMLFHLRARVEHPPRHPP